MPAKSIKTAKPYSKAWQNKSLKKPKHHSNLDDLLLRRASLSELDDSSCEKFAQYPLSDKTLKGLKTNSFVRPTLVQRRSLKHTLSGRDVVVQAETGSGKTLAFVIPILEIIYTEKITHFDGPVALILTPTRELAHQIYQVFSRVGKFHQFTLLDVMGGKTQTEKKLEWQCIAKANVVISTPGRFAQHLQENSALDLSNLRIIVLDEGDRLLDFTFRHDLQIITDNLTAERQCLVFSATLSRTPGYLEYLSLKSPIMISTNDSVSSSTPSRLVQSYTVVPLQKKFDFLWTFLQSHCKKKIIVFFSTQKQVRFAHDLWLQLRPFYSVMQLRGNMLQSKRFKVYERFSQMPHGAVLFATNIAERGLDFPEVHWVVQFDCPKHLDDYIHRVGRTARADKIGRAITFLLPSEVTIVDLLRKRNIALRHQSFPDARIKPYVSSKAPILLASQLALAASARAAFLAYLRDYSFTPKRFTITKPGQEHLGYAHQPDMSAIFDVSQLPVAEFAASLGLPTVPSMPKRMEQQLRLGASALLTSTAKTRREETTTAVSGDQKVIWSALVGEAAGIDEQDDTGPEGLLKRKAFTALEANPRLKEILETRGGRLLDVVSSSDASSSDEDTVTKGDEDSQRKDLSKLSADGFVIEKPKKSLTRVQLAKCELKKNIHSHSKIDFDDSGHPLIKYVGGVPIFDAGGAVVENTSTSAIPVARLDLEKERLRLKTIVDVQDKSRWRKRVREEHRRQRKKAKEARKEVTHSGGAELQGDSVPILTSPQSARDENSSSDEDERASDDPQVSSNPPKKLRFR